MAKKKEDKQIIELTQESFDELNTELESRKGTLRDEIAEEISEARALGDLSENHAYTVAMEKRERNENRISELEILLKNVEIVSNKSSNKVVSIGKKVKITNLSNNKDREVILSGTEETEAADPREGKLSVDSPLGQALYNAKIGETVTVETPVGETKYKIVSVS